MSAALIPPVYVPIARTDADWGFDINFDGEDWTGSAVEVSFARQGLPRETFTVAIGTGVLPPSAEASVSIRIPASVWAEQTPGTYTAQVNKIDGDAVDDAAVFKVMLYRGISNLPLGTEVAPPPAGDGTATGGVIVQRSGSVAVVRAAGARGLNEAELLFASGLIDAPTVEALNAYRIVPVVEQVEAAAAQVALAGEQVGLATDQVGLATQQAELAAQKVELASDQVALASEQVGLASGQVDLAAQQALIATASKEGAEAAQMAGEAERAAAEVAREQAELAAIAAASNGRTYASTAAAQADGTLANGAYYIVASTGEVWLKVSSASSTATGFAHTSRSELDAEVTERQALIDRAPTSQFFFPMRDPQGRMAWGLDPVTLDMVNPGYQAFKAEVDGGRYVKVDPIGKALLAHHDARGFSPFAVYLDTIRHPELDAWRVQLAQLGAGASARPIVATIGNSITDQVSDNRLVFARGYMSWLQMMTDARFDFDPANNFGVSGDTTSQIRDRLPALVACPADIVIGGFLATNDCPLEVNISAAQSVDNMEAIVAAVVDSGKRIILVADLPRGKVGGENWRLDQAGEIEHLFTVRKWVLAQRARKNVYVADPYLSWSDQASTFGDALGNVTWDGIHPSCYGAYLLAEALQPVIEFLCPLASRLPVSNLDLFSSANPGGSLTLNPLMLGMAGSKTNANGDVANGFTLTGSTQVTVAASKVFDGLKAWQEIVITGTPTSNQDITLSQTLMAGAVEGDILDLVGEIAVNAGSTGYRGVGLQLIATVEGVNQIASTGEAWADTFCDMPDAYGGVVVTPTLTLTGTPSTSLGRIRIPLIANVPVSITLRVRGLAPRKVLYR